MAPWTLVDYIEITDVPDGTPILDQTVEDSCLFLTGYASSYSNTLGYLGLVNVTWSVENTGSDALTNPTYGTSSMFISGTTSGTAVWSIEDGHGHTDSIEFIIVEYVPPTVDYIIIADSSNGNPILDQSVENSCLMLTGYASAYNNSEAVSYTHLRAHET